MAGDFFKKTFFSLLCASLLSTPFLVLSEESTQQSAPSESGDVQSDTPTPSEPTAPSDSSSTEESSTATAEQQTQTGEVQGYFIDNTKPKNERVVEGAVSTDQSYKISHKETPTENTEAPAAESATVTEQTHTTDSTPVTQQETAPEPEPQPLAEPKEVPKPVEQAQEVPPPLRIFTKKIFVNKDAVHTCTAEVFTVDMSKQSSAQNTLNLTKEADIAYEVEVGSLPTGIDVRFTDTNDYSKQIGLEDTAVDFTITKKANAATGSFTIPIIYTQKGVFDSSVICQVNVVNR